MEKMINNLKVFLGGTCNESTWRDELIPKLKIDYFNPVVDDWTPECQAEEERQKSEECNVHLYVITPKQTGVFSSAEMIESSYNKNVITVIYIQDEDGTGFTFDESRKRSWKAVVKMAQKHGAFVLNSLDEVALYLNELKKQFVVTLSNNNKTVTSTNIQPITYTTTKTNEVYTYD
jgi:hypothetical protein